MGLDLTSVPLGMWNRGLVVMGGRVLGDDVGLEWGLGVGWGAGWGVSGWWRRDGSGRQYTGGLGRVPSVVRVGAGSHSIGAHMAPCQQCNYSTF